MLEVLFLDPKAFTRQCIVSAMSSRANGIRIIPAADADEALTLITASRPAAAVVHTGAHEINAEPFAQQIGLLKVTFPDLPLLVLSERSEIELVRGALRNQIRGYLTTDMEIHVTVGAIRLVCAGGIYVPASCLPVHGSLAMSPKSAEPALSTDGINSPLEGRLTARQLAIVMRLCEGRTNRSIASDLGMCESTVKVHVRNIMRRLGVTNRTQIVAIANRDARFVNGAPVDQDLQSA